jgi:filamentous hemagglutinin family protein
MPGSAATAGRACAITRQVGGYALCLLAALLWPLAGSAEVATDGMLGAKVRLTGRDVRIPARLGQIRGQNLFHSFQRFGIERGQKVTFTAPDRLRLKNVIGRVTGGERSTIDGTLASRVKGAELWLLNPAGILFGPHARLDVSGAFHASTADELRFEDGAVFSALDTQGSVLSVAAPEAFGFLHVKPAGITIDQHARSAGGQGAVSGRRRYRCRGWQAPGRGRDGGAGGSRGGGRSRARCRCGRARWRDDPPDRESGGGDHR